MGGTLTWPMRMLAPTSSIRMWPSSSMEFPAVPSSGRKSCTKTHSGQAWGPPQQLPAESEAGGPLLVRAVGRPPEQQSKRGLWSQTPWVQIPTPPLTACVTLGKFLKLSVPSFPQLQTGNDKSSSSQRVVVKLIKYVNTRRQSLEYFLTCAAHSVSSSIVVVTTMLSLPYHDQLCKRRGQATKRSGLRSAFAGRGCNPCPIVCQDCFQEASPGCAPPCLALSRAGWW